jgi:hypothetical protein
MAQAGVRHQRQAGAGRDDGDAFIKADVNDSTLNALHDASLWLLTAMTGLYVSLADIKS